MLVVPLNGTVQGGSQLTFSGCLLFALTAGALKDQDGWPPCRTGA